MPSHPLVAWIGRTDLKAAAGEPDAGVGPIAQGVQAGSYDPIYLLSDFPAAEAKSYIKWLESRTGAAIHLHTVRLTSPINFGEIYERVVEVLEAIDRRGTQLTYHLSPGTPAMASVWILLAKTTHPARLIHNALNVSEQSHTPFL
ncbi:hypothetical protein [Accumulibacter sp.]|uniref:hypothetical protein n=1 Tax=Accumulibacter sp. TaxID=2053492 RepID=UPI00260719F3|nr:hypothetical protein [Accumulibacter sp.]